MDYSNSPPGGCRIPAVLVQLADSFGDVDTTQPDAKVKVHWWEPKPPNGRYDGDWRKWTNSRRSQCVSEIERDEVVMVDVQFTRSAELAGGYRRLSKATKQKIASDTRFNYADYSHAPPS